MPDGAVYTPGQGPARLCGLEAPDVKKLRGKVGGNWEPIDSGSSYYESFADSSAKRILVFTTADHPAHPAAICREFLPVGPGSVINMSVRCSNSREVCDKLVTDFTNHDRAVVKQLEQ